jgi:vacuolar-type H+-ATPase subunit I/STV1
MSNISKSNIKLVDIINKKLLKNIKNKKALETFSKHINSIKGSISELKKFNEKVNLVSDKVNTFAKLKQIDINQRNKARELKNLSPSTFNYKKEIDRSTHTFNLPVFKNHKNKINKVIDLIKK